MAINVNVRILRNRFSSYSKEVQRAYVQGLNDVVDDLVRTSSESAPHDKGILEKSWTKQIKTTGSEPVAEISYAVKKQGGKGNYNYALKMHEGGYSLGAGSRAKPGGTGMSGKRYPVGAGYLGDVLKGEEQAYKKHIEKEIQKVNRNFRI